MTDRKIFCSVPWTNVHIYWNGSFGACCSESHKPYKLDDQHVYNLKNMTVQAWVNSKPMKSLRQEILLDSKLTQCSSCYSEESHSYESRRIRENFKTVIFTEQAFDRSYVESTYIQDFVREDNTTQRLPRDWHVDSGNECNLACKMCIPSASSKISHYYDKWGLQSQSANNN